MRRSLWILLLGLVFSGGVRGETYPWSDLAWENFRVECKNQTRGSKACEQEICGDRARWPVAVPIGSVKGMAEACKKRLAEEAVRKAEQAKQAEARKQQERQAAQQRMAAEEKRKREAAARRAEAAAQKKAEAEREAHFRAAANRPAQEEPAPFSERTTELGLVFVRLPGGRFRMGCDDPNAKGDAKCWSSEMWSDGKAQHEVEISAPFWLGKYEVTQKQWRAVMGDAPMKQGNSRPALLGDDKPVGNVPYNRVLEFIDRLNAREGRDGSAGHERYRLPTEAEWEYAARAGTQTPWSCGSNARCLNEMGARF
ncbi:MAG: formylglycine-generating enzyme family protein, partial [Zoogloeaceae bacterium]|nr:formylglycine-generating enzyme family protein [Zoogloeaceae bacterium]